MTNVSVRFLKKSGTAIHEVIVNWSRRRSHELIVALAVTVLFVATLQRSIMTRTRQIQICTRENNYADPRFSRVWRLVSSSCWWTSNITRRFSILRRLNREGCRRAVIAETNSSESTFRITSSIWRSHFSLMRRFGPVSSVLHVISAVYVESSKEVWVALIGLYVQSDADRSDLWRRSWSWDSQCSDSM